MKQQWNLLKILITEEATEGVRGMLERKDKIMGFGHAIYRTSDPRNVIIKQWQKSSRRT